MKVLMVNGSPHKNGCTKAALEETASTIVEAGIGVDYFWIGNKPIKFKPAAAVASARRAGTVSTLDVMNKYFLHGQMPIVPSRYFY